MSSRLIVRARERYSPGELFVLRVPRIAAEGFVRSVADRWEREADVMARHLEEERPQLDWSPRVARDTSLVVDGRAKTRRKFERSVRGARTSTTSPRGWRSGQSILDEPDSGRELSARDTAESERGFELASPSAAPEEPEADGRRGSPLASDLAPGLERIGIPLRRSMDTEARGGRRSNDEPNRRAAETPGAGEPAEPGDASRSAMTGPTRPDRAEAAPRRGLPARDGAAVPRGAAIPSPFADQTSARDLESSEATGRCFRRDDLKRRVAEATDALDERLRFERALREWKETEF